MEIGVSTRHVLAMRGQMRANEANRAVHQLHADRSASLVSHHAQKTRRGGRGCNSKRTNALTHHVRHTISKRFANEHAQENTDKDLVLDQHVARLLPFKSFCDSHIVLGATVQSVRYHLQPNTGSLLTLRFENHGCCCQIHHFLETHDVDIGLQEKRQKRSYSGLAGHRARQPDIDVLVNLFAVHIPGS